MTRTEALNRCLRTLQASTPDIEASAVVSEDGLIIASALGEGIEDSRVAAMSAAMLMMGSRVSAELKRGSVQQVMIKGDGGYGIIMSAGDHAVLLVLTTKDAKLGLVFFELNRAAQEVKGILQ